MTARGDVRHLRTKRRRRRIMRGVVKTTFWVLVLAGTFVLGLGYGKTLSGEDERSSEHVTVTVPRDPVTATLPTKTVTVTVTPAGKGASGPAQPEAGRDRPVR